MNIPIIEVFRYDLPLARPLPPRCATVDVRSGLIVKISDGPDRVGCGDIAPLPGFSTESLDEAVDVRHRMDAARRHDPRHRKHRRRAPPRPAPLGSIRRRDRHVAVSGACRP